MVSILTLSGASFINVRRRAWATSATAVPLASPPAETVSSDRLASAAEKRAVSAAATASLNATSATESLSRLSPLSRTRNWGGSGILSTKLLTATVSVDASAAASAKATARGISGSSACTPKPSTAMVTATSPTARPSTGPIERRSSRLGTCQASM